MVQFLLLINIGRKEELNMKYGIILLITLLSVSCCKIFMPDSEPPAVPRGVTSITGDERVYLQWLKFWENWIRRRDSGLGCFE